RTHGRSGGVCHLVSGQAWIPSSGSHRAKNGGITGLASDRGTATVMTPTLPLQLMVLVGVAPPAALVALLSAASLANRPLPERWTGRLAAGSMLTSCAGLSAALLVYGTTISGTTLVSYGAWSTSHPGGIAIDFLVDRVSLGFSALSAAIAGVVS